MSMLADDYRFVVAVDTHRDTHTAAVLVTGTGAAVDIEQVPADPGGYDELITVADRYGVTPERVWVIEGAGSYGAGLARHLLDRGERIIEVDRPTRPKRRNGAKSDEIDAVRSGREALTRRYPGEPRSLNGDRAALAVLLTTRRSAKDAAKTAKQQLHALIISAPEILRDRFRGLSTTRMITLAAKLRINPAWDSETRIVAGALRQLARRARDLDNEAVTHRNHIELIVKAWRPDLLDQKGVGPVVAATILCAWSHPGRFHNEAAFANLAGVAPIEASSGLVTRHRLNRYGDRQLNQALHTIVLCRLRYDPATRAYAARRTAEGKTPAEIRRCLKRYVSRQIYRLLENPT